MYIYTHTCAFRDYNRIHWGFIKQPWRGCLSLFFLCYSPHVSISPSYHLCPARSPSQLPLLTPVVPLYCPGFCVYSVLHNHIWRFGAKKTQMGDNMRCLSLQVMVTSLDIIISRSFHVLVHFTLLFLTTGQDARVRVDLVFMFVWWRTFRQFPFSVYCEWGTVNIAKQLSSVEWNARSLRHTPRAKEMGHMVVLVSAFWEFSTVISRAAAPVPSIIKSEWGLLFSRMFFGWRTSKFLSTLPLWLGWDEISKLFRFLFP